MLGYASLAQQLRSANELNTLTSRNFSFRDACRSSASTPCRAVQTSTLAGAGFKSALVNSVGRILFDS